MHKYTKLEQESAYFRDVLSQLDAYQILYGVLRVAAQPFGQISIYRGERDPEFGRRDQDTLRGLLRYLSIGLRPLRSSAHAASPAEVVEEWLGIVGVDGTLDQRAAGLVPSGAARLRSRMSHRARRTTNSAPWRRFCASSAHD